MTYPTKPKRQPPKKSSYELQMRYEGRTAWNLDIQRLLRHRKHEGHTLVGRAHSGYVAEIVRIGNFDSILSMLVVVLWVPFVRDVVDGNSELRYLESCKSLRFSSLVPDKRFCFLATDLSGERRGIVHQLGHGIPAYSGSIEGEKEGHIHACENCGAFGIAETIALHRLAYNELFAASLRFGVAFLMLYGFVPSQFVSSFVACWPFAIPSI